MKGGDFEKDDFKQNGQVAIYILELPIIQNKIHIKTGKARN